MLQVELRVNGILIDCIDIHNTGRVVEYHGNGRKTLLYEIGRREQFTETTNHNPADGALALASDALRLMAQQAGKEQE